MQILVNALSSTSLAGERVVSNLLQHIAEEMTDAHHWLVVSPGPYISEACRGLPNVHVVEGPLSTDHWVSRAAWEVLHLRLLAKRWGADLVLDFSGFRVPWLQVPQVCFAANPRPFVSVPFRNRDHWVKHRLQRSVIRWSSRGAYCTVFNSEHLRALHLESSASSDRRSVIVPHGLPEDVFVAAQQLRSQARRLNHVVSASVWSPYKGAETMVDAIAELHRRYGFSATLTLIGPWPDLTYRRAVEQKVDTLGLGSVVHIAGYLSEEEMYAEYASAQAFCLPSYTESFGLPALEAQAFGTPTVGSSTTAMPEICADGGMYCQPGQADVLAGHLAEILASNHVWARLSAAARANAHRYTWARAVSPLVSLIEDRAADSMAPSRASHSVTA